MYKKNLTFLNNQVSVFQRLAYTTMTKPTIPQTMHALQAIKFGPAEESLKYNEIKTPEVTHPADILVKVKAAGVNQAEAKGRAGNFPGPKNPPLVFGGDYAGIIVDKGPKVTGFNIGDAVYGSLKMPIGPNGTCIVKYKK